MALTNPEDAYAGRIVYLYPNTRTAGEWCWRKKTAAIVDRIHWPRIHVELEHQGRTVESYPHRLDVMLRPTGGTTAKQEKKGGDMAGGGMIESRPKTMPGKNKYGIQLGPEEEQGTLW